jgi:hypothetical protein
LSPGAQAAATAFSSRASRQWQGVGQGDVLFADEAMKLEL